jgi:hypothetical protein
MLDHERLVSLITRRVGRRPDGGLAERIAADIEAEIEACASTTSADPDRCLAWTPEALSMLDQFPEERRKQAARDIEVCACEMGLYRVTGHVVRCAATWYDDD